MKALKFHPLALYFLIVCSSYGIAQEFSEYLIATDYNCWSTVAIDMDNDNDIDIVGSSRTNSKVAWWENDGNENFTEHVIATNAWYAMGINAADLDNDYDIDIVCAIQEANEVWWWENDGNQSFSQHIAASIISPSYIHIDNVDSDEDLDILVAACEDNSDKIVWLENTGQPGFNLHIIKDEWEHANSIYSDDLDQDGDIDIIATASFNTAPQNGEISWFENDGQQNFIEHNILSNYGKPSCAISYDIDADGDIDILASVCAFHRIIWLENDGQENFTDHIITTGFSRPHNICIADMDNDGDNDILGAAINANQIAWFENIDNNFTKHLVSNTFDGATTVFAEDIDGDGDTDILGGSQFSNQIAWWENSLYTSIDNSNEDTGTMEDITCYPNPFHDKVKITFFNEKAGDVAFSILCLNGEKTRIERSMYFEIGNQTFVWDLKSISNSSILLPGIYYLETKVLNRTIYNKIIKL